MPNSVKIPLSEKDYFSIIDLQHRFVQCKDWNGLNTLLKNYLLPLISCNSMTYGWRDLDLVVKQVKITNFLGIIGLEREDADFLIQITPYSKSINKKLLTSSRSVVASDVDVPIKTICKETALFQSDRPEYECPGDVICILNKKRVTAYMTAIDRLENGLGMAVHRFFPNKKPFTLRDVRFVELLRPILFQTIKTITLSEELAKHKSLAESLANIPTGVALVRNDMRVIFLNKTFQELIPIEPGHKLPASLENAVKTEIERTSKPKELLDTLPNQPFYKFSDGDFRLSIDRINRDAEGQCYLLRIKPTNDAFSQLNIKLQTGDLSNREKEICCLAKDGFTNEQIGERLFISKDTVKTHIKFIYKKLNIHTRAKLVALLHR